MNSSISWPCAALSRASLASRTTLKVGGSVEWLLEPASPQELTEAWSVAREEGYLPRILGGGANLIVPDGEHPWVVITTERMNRVFRPGMDPGPQGDGEAELFERELPPAPDPGDGASDTRLIAWAGAGMPGLVRTARELSWTGLEGLVGVPGHIGGGVAMNAGGRWGELWDVVERVRVLTPDGEVEDRLRSQCQPGYRQGNLGGAVVLGVVLRLERGNKAEIQEQMRQYLAEKSAAQPVTERSCGCIFKNPDPELSEGRSAGQLIEACGGKGLRRGDAVVSEKHANFIVNRGGARAEDVLGLIEDVRRQVLERSGVRLASEAQVWR